MFSAAAFLAVFLGCAVLALVRHPIYGLYLYLGVFYIHPPSRWWNSMVPDLRWSLLAAGVALLAVFIHRKKLVSAARPWYTTAPGLVLLLLVGWLWVQNFWALDSEAHFNASVQYTKYVVVFYLMYRLASNPTEATNVLLLHVAGCLFLGLLAFYTGRTYGDRLDGVGGPGLDDANSLGMFLATGVIVGAMLILVLKGWRRVAVILAMPFILNGVVLSGSRGAFLGLLAGGAVLFFLRPPQRRWTFWGSAVLGAILAVTLMDDQFIERVLSIQTAVQNQGEIDDSAEGRLVLVEAQFEMASHYPHGAGHRGTAALSPQYLDARWLSYWIGWEAYAARSSHNTFMTFLVEQGILGALLYLWVSLWGFWVLVRLKGLQRRRAPLELTAPAIACCCGIAVVWTAGQFTDYMLTEVQIWLFGLLAASLEQIRQESAQKTTVADTSPSRRPLGARQAM